LQEALGDEGVEAGDDEGEMLARGVESAFEGGVRGSGRGVEFEFGFRDASPAFLIDLVIQREAKDLCTRRQRRWCKGIQRSFGPQRARASG